MKILDSQEKKAFFRFFFRHKNGFCLKKIFRKKRVQFPLEEKGFLVPEEEEGPLPEEEGLLLPEGVGFLTLEEEGLPLLPEEEAFIFRKQKAFFFKHAAPEID